MRKPLFNPFAPSLREMAPAALLLLALAAVLVGGIWLTAPRGPPEAVYGRVSGFRIEESETGSHMNVLARVGDRDVIASFAAPGACLKGDRIALWRRRTVLGEHYSVRGEVCGRDGAA